MQKQRPKPDGKVVSIVVVKRPRPYVRLSRQMASLLCTGGLVPFLGHACADHTIYLHGRPFAPSLHAHTAP